MARNAAKFPKICGYETGILLTSTEKPRITGASHSPMVGCFAGFGNNKEIHRFHATSMKSLRSILTIALPVRHGRRDLRANIFQHQLRSRFRIPVRRPARRRFIRRQSLSRAWDSKLTAFPSRSTIFRTLIRQTLMCCWLGPAGKT